MSGRGVAGDAPDEVPEVDLRSDTVTLPSDGMRQAMASAEVGDDVLGGDPTTRKLEERVAELLGKERALFFPSGTMANQTALALIGGWGGEVVVEGDAHVFHWEEGAAAALAGVQLRPVPTPDGVLTAERVAAALRPPSRYHPRSRGVALENTHLASGGRVLDPDVAASVGALARERGLRVHLDGARLWHACAETGRAPTAWTRHVDTVMVSLSKGLGAPVGSMLAGPGDLMEEAWRVRRRLGGAMRQSGILAAAGLYALDHEMPRLKEDHERARRLAAAFGRVPGLTPVAPETNVLLVDCGADAVSPDELLSFLHKHRILMLKFGPERLRAVTHRGVGPREIAHTVRVLGLLERSRNPGTGVA